MPSFGAFSSEPATATLTIESDPPGADASISTGASCRTPCSLALPVADTLVSYALRGYLPQTVPVRPLRGESGLFGSLGTATQFDPNPVFAALQPATPSKPPPPKKRKRPTTAAAPPPAAPPPSMGGLAPPHAHGPVIAAAPRLAKTAAIWDATLVRMVANCSSAAIRRRCPCRADQHRRDRPPPQDKSLLPWMPAPYRRVRCAFISIAIERTNYRRSLHEK